MQGEVLAAASAASWGVISGQDGRRYHFRNEDVRGGQAPPGARVDFQVSGQQAIDIYVLQAATPRTPAPGRKRDWVAFYFSPKGRISRREFWLLGILPVTAVGLLVGWIPLIGLLFACVMAWCFVALGVKRFHDRGYSGWWSVAGYAPAIAAVALLVSAFFSGGSYQPGILLAVLANIIFFLQLALVYVRAGVRGPNAYGPDPLEGQP